MPWLVALIGASYLLAGEVNKSGLLRMLGSQANTPETEGSIDRAADKLSGAGALSLLLVSGAFAYSLVKR